MGVEIGWLKITNKKSKSRFVPISIPARYHIHYSLDSCGNKQHNVQQLDDPPRTILNHWTFLLLSSLPLCDPCPPLNLPTCSLLPRWVLYSVSFSQEVSASSKLKGTDLLQYSSTAAVIGLVLDPVLQPAVSFAWGRAIHPGAWGTRGGKLLLLPGCWIKGTVKQQECHTRGLCMHSFSKYR